MLLTTITAYWKRPEMLRTWVRCIKASSVPEVQHLIYFVGEDTPDWWEQETAGFPIQALRQFEAPGLSIGHYHNLGARQASTDWIMKMDIDSLPHTDFFSQLLPIIAHAKPRQWFNVGMFYLSNHYSQSICNGGPLTRQTYETIMRYRPTYAANSYLLPAASNFLCRRNTFMNLGGCDERFRGYGWEDYQEIYMLEKHERQAEPLPGPVSLKNVTQRCRDEISRPKARALWEKHQWICLIHKWHPATADPAYRATMDQNRQVLLEWVRPPQNG